MPGVFDTTFLSCHGAYEAAGPPDPTPDGQEAIDAPCGGDQQYAHLVEHGFFKGQFDLASAVLPNPKKC